jgi:hypothetical protein
MNMQKSRPRQGRTLSHGEFDAWETVVKCAAGCRHLSGEKVIARASVLTEEFPSKHVVGYDVIVFVGIKRYLEHRQREEIRAALLIEYGITLSSGEVSNLGRLFLEYLLRLHKAHIKELRAAFDSDGGNPWHIGGLEAPHRSRRRHLTLFAGSSPRFRGAMCCGAGSRTCDEPCCG